MDLVGSLLKSAQGHEYILVMVDYTTCYPEAGRPRHGTSPENWLCCSSVWASLKICSLTKVHHSCQNEWWMCVSCYCWGVKILPGRSPIHINDWSHSPSMDGKNDGYKYIYNLLVFVPTRLFFPGPAQGRGLAQKCQEDVLDIRPLGWAKMKGRLREKGGVGCGDFFNSSKNPPQKRITASHTTVPWMLKAKTYERLDCPRCSLSRVSLKRRAHFFTLFLRSMSVFSPS